MSQIPGLTDFTLLEPDEKANSKVKASISYKVRQPNHLTWITRGKPYNAIYYEITYRVLKKSNTTCLGKTLRIPNNAIAHLLSSLNIIIKNIDCYSLNDVTKDPHPSINYEYEETNQLSNIDGYIATTGVKTKIVLRSTLTPGEKEKAMQELLIKVEHRPEPSVHLWKLETEHE